MIINKLKIIFLKTYFIVFRSPQLRRDLSGLSLNIGESQITQSLKVRDLGVRIDQFFNYYDHITPICITHIFILYIFIVIHVHGTNNLHIILVI